MVGRAVVQRFTSRGDYEILCAGRSALDLTDKQAVRRWWACERPEAAVICAGHVGGIHANSANQVKFLTINAEIALNTIQAAAEYDCKRLIYLGSSCIYPRGVEQPMDTDALLSGPLEPTNEGYAIAKILGVKLVEQYYADGYDFTAVMPCNLYGSYDNFDYETSHVLPAMIAKFHKAKHVGTREVKLWGSGEPRREFMFVKDCANGISKIFDKLHQPIVNLGPGKDVSIRELAETVRKVVYPEAKIVWDTSKPDGVPQKLMKSERVRLVGWYPKTQLEKGIWSVYENYRKSLVDEHGDPRPSVRRPG